MEINWEHDDPNQHVANCFREFRFGIHFHSNEGNKYRKKSRKKYFLTPKDVIYSKRRRRRGSIGENNNNSFHFHRHKTKSGQIICSCIFEGENNKKNLLISLNVCLTIYSESGKKDVSMSWLKSQQVARNQKMDRSLPLIRSSSILIQLFSHLLISLFIADPICSFVSTRNLTMDLIHGGCNQWPSQSITQTSDYPFFDSKKMIHLLLFLFSFFFCCIHRSSLFLSVPDRRRVTINYISFVS